MGRGELVDVLRARHQRGDHTRGLVEREPGRNLLTLGSTQPLVNGDLTGTALEGQNRLRLHECADHLARLVYRARAGVIQHSEGTSRSLDSLAVHAVESA